MTRTRAAIQRDDVPTPPQHVVLVLLKRGPVHRHVIRRNGRYDDVWYFRRDTADEQHVEGTTLKALVRRDWARHHGPTEIRLTPLGERALQRAVEAAAASAEVPPC